MKRHNKLILWVILLLVFLIPISTQASELGEDKVIFGGNFTLLSGETLDGDLVIFGGNASLEEDTTVNGDVAVLGGRVQVNGIIRGDLVALGGFVELESKAVVLGNLTVLGSNIEESEGAVIQGTMVTHTDLPTEVTLPSIVQLSRGTFPRTRLRRNPFLSLSWFFFKVLVWAGLAVLATLFLKTQEVRVKEAAFSQPVISWVVGFLVVILLPVTVIALLITLLLSPLSILAVLIGFAAWALGWVSLGFEVGHRLTKNAENKWHPALVAGLGTFVLTAIFNGFSKLIPCFGFFPKSIVGMWMLGAVVLTQFGTQRYPRALETDQPQGNHEVLPDDMDPAPGVNGEGSDVS
ncbi:MAG: polymer-forming cytoskeletal protein [Anaerolineales bacterium]|nr:polymer-forming cytoskeletal protein [Anaerolineales bacterium]